MRSPMASKLALLLVLLAPACSAQECDTANGWYGNEGVGACFHLVRDDPRPIAINFR